MWVRGGHQFVLFPKGDKELSWHFQALLPTFVFFLLSQQQIVSLFSVLAEFYCTNYWDLFFSVSKSFKSQVLVNSIDTFLTFQFQEVEKSQLSVDFASWEIFRKARKKSHKKEVYCTIKKKAFHSSFFPLWFQTCQCTLWSSKIHRRFLKVTTSGHFHVGSQVWFKPTI